jgi:hypothetical protein
MVLMTHNTLNNQINQNNVSKAHMRNGDEGHVVHLEDLMLQMCLAAACLTAQSRDSIQSALLRQQ